MFSYLCCYEIAAADVFSLIHLIDIIPLLLFSVSLFI